MFFNPMDKIFLKEMSYREEIRQSILKRDIESNWPKLRNLAGDWTI